MEGRVHKLIKKQGRITNYAFGFAIYTMLTLLIPVGWVQTQVIPELISISPRGAQRGTTIEIALQGKNIRKATALLFSGDGVSGEINEIKSQATAVFNGRGVLGNIPNDNRLVAQVTIALDAPLGGQNLRIGEFPYLDSIFPLGGKRGMESAISIEGRNLAAVKSMQVSVAPDAPLGVQEVRVTTPSGLSTNPHPFVVGNLPETTETEPNNTRDGANVVALPITLTVRSIRRAMWITLPSKPKKNNDLSLKSILAVLGRC